jgi:type II secretory pathway component PulC
MVKGLVIRQAFMALDLVLALLLVYVIYLIGAKQFEQAPATLSVEELLAGSDDTSLQATKVGPRADYESIVTSRMFGEAGSTPAAVDTPPTEEPRTVQTTAPLKLLGTVASFPTDPLATATIQNESLTTPVKVATYYQGRRVMDELYLVEVHPRKVILDNRAKNQREELIMQEVKAAAGPTLAIAGGLRNRARNLAQASNHVTLNRDDVFQEMQNYDYTDLLATLNPQVAQDEQGNAVGITSDNFAAIPLAQNIGVQNNDVIQTVNGMALDSMDKVYEIAQKLQNANTFRIGVLRNGKPQMLTFKLE